MGEQSHLIESGRQVGRIGISVVLILYDLQAIPNFQANSKGQKEHPQDTRVSRPHESLAKLMGEEVQLIFCTTDVLVQSPFQTTG